MSKIKDNDLTKEKGPRARRKLENPEGRSPTPPHPTPRGAEGHLWTLREPFSPLFETGRQAQHVNKSRSPYSRRHFRPNFQNVPEEEPHVTSETHPEHFVCLRGRGVEARGGPAPPTLVLILLHTGYTTSFSCSRSLRGKIYERATVCTFVCVL